jgi:predicted N-formylglutamate amidohydrolase
MPLHTDRTGALLGPGDPAPVEALRLDGRSPFVLTGDHAGRAIPRALGDLGVSAAELDRHIACDIGIAGVGRRLSALLDAPLVLQTYSRLVIDCNRDPAVESSIVTLSEATAIPGNEAIPTAQRAARRAAIFDPYHAAIAACLDRRAGRETILVSLHSMTPVYLGISRSMHAAVLYDRDDRFARALAAALREPGDCLITENEPYAMSADSDYTVPVHAEGRMPCALVELRQDLIAEPATQDAWAHRLSQALIRARSLYAGECL